MSVNETMEKKIQNTQKVQLSSEERDAVIGRALVARMMSEKAPGEACISLEKISALIDGMLPDPDRNRVMGHLAKCDRCYQVFSLTSELQTSESEETEQVGSGRQNRWYMISGVAAIAAVTVLAIKLSIHTPPDKQQLAQQSAPISQPLVAVAPAPKSSQNSTSPPKPVHADAQHAQKSRNMAELQLLSPDEAAAPGAKQFGFSGKASHDGPGITIESPGEVNQKEGITTLKIRFEPQKADGIDLNSIKLECLKQNPIDLTERIKPYANENGVQADRVKLPLGRHRFRISVADQKGRLSEKDFTILVSFVD